MLAHSTNLAGCEEITRQLAYESYALPSYQGDISAKIPPWRRMGWLKVLSTAHLLTGATLR